MCVCWGACVWRPQGAAEPSALMLPYSLDTGSLAETGSQHVFIKAGWLAILLSLIQSKGFKCAAVAGHGGARL